LERPTEGTSGGPERYLRRPLPPGADQGNVGGLRLPNSE
jgi:hypothetical protein